MSGTRKMSPYELENVSPPRARMISITTPVEAIPIATIAASLPSSPPPASDREPRIEVLRTRLARRFTTLADEVTAALADFRIGAGAWQPELTAPTGMSTGGGKQALQHLRLRPTRQGHLPLVGGLVNAGAKTAELRDHDYMVALQRARLGGKALEITPAEWEQLLRKAEMVLRAEGIATTRVTTPAELRAPGPGQPRVTSRTLAFVALGIIGPLALLVVWRVFAVLLR